MKNLKKDNKGFSLVELIVVVLIMAIIAVALAPQILKWVNNSRISSDQDTMQTVIGNIQTALTNETVYKDVTASDREIKINNTEMTLPSVASLKTKLAEYSGVSEANLETAFKTKTKDNVITIKISKKGAVTGSMTVSVDSIDN